MVDRFLTAGPPFTTSIPDPTLERAILRALDGLLRALVLEPLDHDRFRVLGEPGRFDRIFGGQLIAQALLAACATVEDKEPHSLHAYFVEGGPPEVPLEVAVERVRDGRSVATRRITVTHGGRPLLTAIASFHANAVQPRLAASGPPVPPPHELPLLQDWVREQAPDLARRNRPWVEQPPPLEMRIGEAPAFFGGSASEEARTHWMRLPRDVGDDPRVHVALLAYATDYLLLDMAFRAHPEIDAESAFIGSSLDHAVWFHAPVHLDRWHSYTQEAVAITGHRGLVRGAIHDADGHLVASVVQEVLVRPGTRARTP